VTLSIRNVTFMSADPERLADFWMAATGFTERRQHGDEVVVAPADWGFPRLTFQKIVESRPTPGAQHLDLTADDMAAEVARLEGLGARQLWRIDGAAEGAPTWTAMSDPDGNEFCVVQRPVNERRPAG
jgi:hypothetical protein